MFKFLENRRKQKLAALKARYKELRRLLDPCHDKPAFWVSECLSLSAKIAELESKIGHD